MSLERKTLTVWALGTAQTLSWGSTYYLPAILAAPMARDLGLQVPTVYLAFTLAMLVSAAFGPSSGRAIDRWGGRPVLLVTNLVFAAGIGALAMAQGPVSLFAAWIIIGVGMGSGLYEAAFAALVRLYGRESRNAITGITLIAGFASTVGWPLSTIMEAEIGWRGACWGWALMHLIIGLPLNASIPRAAPRQEAITATPDDTPHSDAQAPASAATHRAMALLACSFALSWFVATAMAAHLPRMLQLGGTTLATAVAVGALIGPAQVAARLAEFGFMRHVHPMISARLAVLGHPLGALAFLVFGAPAAFAFGLLHGAGNGLMTIAKGTLPLVLFGPHGYGERSGILMVPARIAPAFAPWLFGMCLDRWGSDALWLSTGLGLLSTAALMAVRPTAHTTPSAPTGSTTPPAPGH